MHCRLLVVAGLLAAVFSPLLATRAAEQPANRSEDEQAIRAAAKQYVEALDRGDAKQLAESWTADGDYIDEQGISHPANELVVEAARSAGQGQHPQVKLIESSIRFLTDDVAIEDGTSEVSRPGTAGPPSRGRFSVIWVKQDGHWRLASLREVRVGRAPKLARLKDLDWMVGQWTAGSEDTTLEVSARWNTTETFLLRNLTVRRSGKVVFSVAQRIGWDPLEHKLKSWVFDSDGGYGEGTWSTEGDTWMVQTSGVLPDGRQVTAVHQFLRDGPDRFTWKSIDRNIDGERKGDAELLFSRKPAAD